MPGEAGETWRNEDEQGKRRPQKDGAVKNGNGWRRMEKAGESGRSGEG